jgi:hypothetical protein
MQQWRGEGVFWQPMHAGVEVHLSLGWCTEADRQPKSLQLRLMLAKDLFGLLQGELGELDDLGL